MIIGHGDIASILKDREGAILFASGVSNSQCEDEAEYLREKKMIESFRLMKDSITFFYFSSISIYFNANRYTKHKEEMETLIRSMYINHNIIRIGNIWGGSNPNTFLNYLSNRINNNEPVEIKDEWRYIITRHELQTVVQSLPLQNGGLSISVFGEAMKVDEALKHYMEWKK